MAGSCRSSRQHCMLCPTSQTSSKSSPSARMWHRRSAWRRSTYSWSATWPPLMSSTRCTPWWITSRAQLQCEGMPSGRHFQRQTSQNHCEASWQDTLACIPQSGPESGWSGRGQPWFLKSHFGANKQPPYFWITFNFTAAQTYCFHFSVIKIS